MSYFPRIQSVNTVEGQGFRIFCPTVMNITLIRTLQDTYNQNIAPNPTVVLKIILFWLSWLPTEAMRFYFAFKDFIGYLIPLPGIPYLLLEQAVWSASLHETPCGEHGFFTCLATSPYLKEKAFGLYETHLYTFKKSEWFSSFKNAYPSHIKSYLCFFQSCGGQAWSLRQCELWWITLFAPKT